jgi:hypothetical protein
VSAAALGGTRGLQVQITNTADRYLLDLRPSAELRYRARFRWSPNAVQMAAGSAHDLFSGYSGSGSRIFRIQLQYAAGGYQLRAGVLPNSGAETFTAWVPVSGAAHTLELSWQAASSSGARDGTLSLWIDGASAQTKSGLANGTRRLEEVRLGLTNVSAGISGSEYFDDFISTRGDLIVP